LKVDSGLRVALLAAISATMATAAVSSVAQTTQPAVAVAPSDTLRQSRNATIEDLAAKLERKYVFPETGRKYAAMLRANSAAGKYAAIADDKTFAKLVSDDLEAVAFDGHLKLVPKPTASAGGGGGPKGLPDTIQAQERLPGDVAYIRLGKFFGEPEETAAIKKFVEDNSDAKTLIFDVRIHIGGGLDEMDAMFPYLFDKETVLVGMDTRDSVKSPLEDGPRLRKAAASPAGVVRREHFVVPAAGSPLSKAKIFVLASGRTRVGGRAFRAFAEEQRARYGNRRDDLRGGQFRLDRRDRRRFSGVYRCRPKFRTGDRQRVGLCRDRSAHRCSGQGRADRGAGAQRNEPRRRRSRFGKAWAEA
jgi:hypothetical protein